LLKKSLDELILALATGPLYWFRDWPNKAVQCSAGVYTVWHLDGRFIYVGMFGRSITSKTVAGPTPNKLPSRLRSHFSGKRSGDQFCVYVADRLVLPSLTPVDIADVATGRHQMDAHVRQYIHANLGYRFIKVGDGKTAREIENLIKKGEWPQGKPLLNPSG
jgi:hypothetical protein